MHLLTAFSLKNRALIALVTIVAAVFGVIGVGSLKQELMPSVQFPAIAVVATYPGAAPEVVNADVSGPIETALRGVPQLEGTSATSSTGSSMVLAQFTYGVDLAVTEQKVERAISRISAMLPAEADTQVISGSIDDFPVIQVAVTPAEGQSAEDAAALVTRLVTPKLSDIDGVRDAQLSGDRAERVVIRPDLGALAAAGLTTQTLTDTLQQSGVLIAGGTVSEDNRTLAVQAGSTVTSAEDIAALPIAGTPLPPAPAELEVGGALTPGQLPAPDMPAEPAPPITIGSVAAVAIEQAPESSISRVDGKPALTIAVTKMSAANTVEVSHAVQTELDALASQLDGAKVSVIFDQAPYIEDSVETLTTEGLLGLLFAVLVILVFLMSVRATLVTAISIPVSVLFTFIGLNFADYTLNMLTLGALTISIGRVVDDSIVVIENIKRHLGEAGDAAAGQSAQLIVRAVREVSGAITASTVTTVAVFLPMAFVAGMVGELFRPFAFTVTIALVASLLVSLTIVPVLAFWFLRTTPGRAPRKGIWGRAARSGSASQAHAPEAATAMQRGYRPIIEWTLARPAVTLIIAAVILGGTFAATPLMKTNFMGADGQNSVSLVQTLEPGTSLEAQLAQAERVEESLDGIAEVESVQVTIGSGGGGMGAMFGGGGDGAVNYSLTTAADADQAKLQDQIRDELAALDDAGEFAISQSSGGAGMSSSIAVDVAAPDQATLADASDAVLAALRDEPGLQQVESDLGQSRPYLSVTVNRELAASAGVSEAAVAGQMAQQMQPQQIGQITREANVTSVYLVANEIPTDPAGVAALAIQTATGPQRLDALAALEVVDGPVSIHTADGARTVTVSALPVGDDLTAAGSAVSNALDTVDLPAGATASVGGVMSQQSEAFEQLGIALLAAILIVYVVMVATFRSLLQPLLLLASVPFAATGALLLLILTGIPLGVPSLIGVLMLIGVVVTNAIVLVDLVNQYRARGDALRDAVLHGTLQRLRPIVMTALATILALTPMALGVTGQGGFISQPLAVVVIGGLLSSTVLTLVVLPTLYYAVEGRRGRGRGPRRSGGPGGTGGPGGLGGAGGEAAVAGVAGLGGLDGDTGERRRAGGPRRARGAGVIAGAEPAGSADLAGAGTGAGLAGAGAASDAAGAIPFGAVSAGSAVGGAALAGAGSAVAGLTGAGAGVAGAGAGDGPASADADADTTANSTSEADGEAAQETVVDDAPTGPRRRSRLREQREQREPRAPRMSRIERAVREADAASTAAAAAAAGAGVGAAGIAAGTGITGGAAAEAATVPANLGAEAISADAAGAETAGAETADAAGTTPAPSHAAEPTPVVLPEQAEPYTPKLNAADEAPSLVSAVRAAAPEPAEPAAPAAHAPAAVTPEDSLIPDTERELGSGIGESSGIGEAKTAEPQPELDPELDVLPESAEPEGVRKARAAPVVTEPANTDAPVEMSTATAEMSLALEDLGFTGDQNPLVSRSVDPSVAARLRRAEQPLTEDVMPTPPAKFASDVWDPTSRDDLAPLVLPGPLEAEAQGAKSASSAATAAPEDHEEISLPLMPGEVAPVVEAEVEAAAVPEAAPVVEAEAEAAPEPAAVAATRLMPEVEPDPELVVATQVLPVVAPDPAPAPAEEPWDIEADEADESNEAERSDDADESAEPEAPAINRPLAPPGMFQAPPVTAPPVTGELNWEQLMWEATQEAEGGPADEPTAEASTEPAAAEPSDQAPISANDPAESSAPKTHPAEDSDRVNDTGKSPSEEH
ncbi:HAE1 family hydrophobic/amphiphilic exporter-1 [Leucobacter exalbidus]|uniref:HAE1 family hydrophobic/amphiphilic exporter-1 n=1 Tax=Leucobacter exalbidus TaxID=662960 RepID=A0A940PPY0_9MICO|nr:efflux RND transporter permease subunit [Leucobacter exalbidus]MBP1327173.1 HAE1 family hydrophobic/amphiphilic exporter-1 [Leucobacter exalbidus]